MPSRPPKPCARPGCYELVYEGAYCDVHKQAYDKARGSSYSRGYNHKWRKIRKLKLAKHPLCENCLAADLTRIAVLVHHIDCNSTNNNYNNLKSLCNACHEKIHNRSQKK